MKVLTGKNGLMSIYVDLAWVPVLCASEAAFEFDHEEILKTSRNSGKYRERVTRLMDWGFSVSGLTKIDDSDGQKGFFYLAQASVRGSEVLMRIRFTDDDGNTQDISGNVLVKQGSIRATVGAFSFVSFYFPGSGEPDLGDTITGAPTNLYKIYLDTTEGAFEVSHADLAGITNLLLVEREDAGYKVVPGAPAGRQVQYTDLTTSGKFTFDGTLPFNAGEIVYALYEK